MRTALPFAFFLLSLAFLNGSGTLSAQNGLLDPSFDGDGKYTYDVTPNGIDVAYGLAGQSNGKIVVAGYTVNGSATDALVMRMNADGSPDLSFDADGKVVLDLSLGGADRFTDVVLQPDGKIVCTGYVDNGNDFDVVVVRLLADGSYDSSFGTGGKVQTDFGQGEDDQAYAVALQPNGSIVVAGTMDFNNSSNLLIARYTATGAPDTSFDLFGSVTFDPSNGGSDVLFDVAVASDGKIVATGYTEWGPSNLNIIVVRVDAAGQPDVSFSSDGFFNADLLTGASEYGYGVATLSDGSILVAGSTDNSGNTDATLLKIKPNGILDNTFNTDGIAYFDFTLGSTDVFRKVEVQPDGMIVAAGYLDNVGSRDYLVAKMTSTGDLDPAFGVSGWSSADVDGADNMRSMCLLSDGRIMVGGYSTGKVSIVRFTNSFAVGLDEGVDAGTGMQVWPLPCVDHLQLRLPGSWEGTATLELLSLDGRRLHTRTLEPDQAAQVLDLGSQVGRLEAGMYFLRLRSGDALWSASLIKH